MQPLYVAAGFRQGPKVRTKPPYCGDEFMQGERRDLRSGNYGPFQLKESGNWDYRNSPYNPENQGAPAEGRKPAYASSFEQINPWLAQPPFKIA